MEHVRLSVPSVATKYPCAKRPPELRLDPAELDPPALASQSAALLPLGPEQVHIRATPLPSVTANGLPLLPRPVVGAVLKLCRFAGSQSPLGGAPEPLLELPPELVPPPELDPVIPEIELPVIPLLEDKPPELDEPPCSFCSSC